jgi:hypothetical protein
MSFYLSPRVCSSLKSAANCSSSNFIRADAPQYPFTSGDGCNPQRRIRRTCETARKFSASPSLGALPVIRRYIGAPIRSGVEG